MFLTWNDRTDSILPYENTGKSLVAEFLGTFTLVTLAASTAIFAYTITQMDPVRSHLIIAVTVTLVVVTAILLIGKISGAHLNPAISLAHAIAGLMPRRLFIPCVAVQILAAIVAGVFLRLLFYPIHSPTHFGSTKLDEGATHPRSA
jgi:glycerol uptake facilitator-like aquaporin